MRAFTLGVVLLVAGCHGAVFAQSPQTPNTSASKAKVAEPPLPPATAEDLAIAETVLSEVANDKTIHGSMGSRDASQIVVLNKGYENYKPANPHIVMSDLKEFSAALEKARSAPDYMFELDYSVSSGVYEKFLPNSRAILSLTRPRYSKKGTAVFFFTYGPTPHGMAACTYTLRKQKGHWKIVKRDVSIPM